MMSEGCHSPNPNISTTSVKEQANAFFITPSLEYACSVWGPLQ